MQKQAHITRVSAEEIAARLARGESQTDLTRARAKAEQDLERDIAEDPDFRDIPADWYLNAKAVMPEAKRLLSLRVDSDVLDWFKAKGPGYQTRMNAVLRAFMLLSARTGR